MPLASFSQGTASTILRLFPPPAYLTTPSVGLDISDESVKMIRLDRTKRGIRPGCYASRSLPLGIIEAAKIKDPDLLVSILKKLRADFSLHYVRTSLPEEHAYFFQTEVPRSLGRKELQNVIAAELEENVPLSPSESLFDAEFFSATVRKDFLNANVAVYPRRVVEQYLDILGKAGLTPLSLEIESQAFARAVIPRGEEDTVMVVDVGRSKAGLAIVSRGVLLFTATLNIGGDDFTKSIAKSLDVTLEEAERLKQIKAFIKAGSNEPFFNAMLTTMSALRDEVTKHYQYWLEHGVGGTESTRIKKIIMTGGNANIIGIAEYFSATIDLPVVRGNVWTNVCSFDDYIPQISHRPSFRYGTAIGLALGSLT